MQERHLNREKYFKEQVYTTQKYVIPFIEEYLALNANSDILEIGCGEGGNMLPFLDLGCKVTGVDFSKGKIENAHQYFENHKNKANLTLLCDDIYNVPSLGKFDLIIIRDVLEHIHGQEVFFNKLDMFLKPGGKVFLSFPPWQNPFGGHQQMCENKLLSKLPYYHILPAPVYRFILKMGGESEAKIKGLLEVKETGISIERFHRILKDNHYKTDKKILYFINPNYEIKFHLKPRKQSALLSGIYYFRNYLITTCYYLVSLK